MVCEHKDSEKKIIMEEMLLFLYRKKAHFAGVCTVIAMKGVS